MNQIVEKALKLHQEAENAKAEAIQSLLKSRDEITEQLKALGHTEGKSPVQKKRTADPSKPCSVCGQTGHDGRFHRGDKKKTEKKEKPAEAKK